MHLREEVFAEEKLAEDIFAEFVFVKLQRNLEIKFREFFLLGFNSEKNSNFLLYQPRPQGFFLRGKKKEEAIPLTAKRNPGDEVVLI